MLILIYDSFCTKKIILFYKFVNEVLLEQNFFCNECPLFFKLAFYSVITVSKINPTWQRYCFLNLHVHYSEFGLLIFLLERNILIALFFMALNPRFYNPKTYRVISVTRFYVVFNYIFLAFLKWVSIVVVFIVLEATCVSSMFCY